MTDDTRTKREQIAALKVKEGNGFYGDTVNSTINDVLSIIDAPTVQPEPFGYWVEHTISEPVFLRPNSYIPEGKNFKVIPLYAHPSAAPTGNTALLARWVKIAEDRGLVGSLLDESRAALASRAALSQPAAPQPTPEVEALEAVDAYERSTWFGPEGEKNKRRAWKGVMRKVRAALARGSVAEKGER